MNEDEELRQARGQAAAGRPPAMTPEQCASLFRFIEHGDDRHRAWLWQAIYAWAHNTPRPEEQ